jgi:uncharacterized membrane protein
MADLIVVGFKQDLFRASEVLNKLTEVNDNWTLDLYDAVAVYRTYGGDLRIDQRYLSTTGEGAARGTVLGSLLGLVLAIPLTGGLSAVAAGTATAVGAFATGAVGGGALGAATGAIGTHEWRDTFAISEAFVKEVGATIQAGDSAIFVLAQLGDPAKLAAQVRGYGGTVLQTTLPEERIAQIEAVLAGQK